MQIVVQALIRRVFAHKPRPLGRGGWLSVDKVVTVLAHGPFNGGGRNSY